MGKLTHLLKWKKAVIIKDDNGLVAKDENGNPVTVYMRVIGDKDLEDASLIARYTSSMKRAALADPDTRDYQTAVEIFNSANREQAIEMIVQGRAANWTGQALSDVVVPDLPKIEDIAQDPDAPTLVELEKLDKAIEKINDEYKKEVDDYVKSREIVLRAELDEKSLEELIELAKEEVIVVLSIQTYLDTLINEKVWRSVYQDDAYTIPEFKNLDEFENLHISVKRQLIEEYRDLEAGFDDIKN